MHQEYREHIEALIYKYGRDELSENNPVAVINRIDLIKLAETRFRTIDEYEAIEDAHYVLDNREMILNIASSMDGQTQLFNKLHEMYSRTEVFERDIERVLRGE